MGSSLTIINDTQDTVSVKVGPDTQALMISSLVIGVVTTIISGGALLGVFGAQIAILGAGISISSAIAQVSGKMEQVLNQHGYKTLKAGQKHRFGKMTLSLWQQCHCIRSRNIGDDLVVEQLYMRPIFSGPTDQSNNDYRIKQWKNKHGYKEVSRHTFKTKDKFQKPNKLYVKEKEQIKTDQKLHGKTVALLSRSSNKFLDGRSKDNEVAYMTNRNPYGDAYLNWKIIKIGDKIILQSISSKCYLDGRGVSGQDVLVTNRDPTNDSYLQWKLIQTDDKDWFVLQSISSKCYLDGRGGQLNALVTNRNWKQDHFFYFKFIYV